MTSYFLFRLTTHLPQISLPALSVTLRPSTIDWKGLKTQSFHLVPTPSFPCSLLFRSHVQLFMTLWTAAHQASLSFTISPSLLKLVSIELVMPSNHLILCRSLLLLPSIFPSIRVFSNELVLQIRWTKYWSFSFSMNPSNDYSGLISFRMDQFDLLAVQVTPKSLLQQFSFPSLSYFFFLNFFKVSTVTSELRHHIPILSKLHLPPLPPWTFYQQSALHSHLSLLENRISHLPAHPTLTQVTTNFRHKYYKTTFL